MTKSLRRNVSRQLVAIDRMKVRTNVSQRELKMAWAQELSQDFNLDKFGVITLNLIGGFYWIVDGQHRIEALKLWLKDWKDQKIECDVYEGLSEGEEAEMFLSLNYRKAVTSIANYRVALTAGREMQVNIEAVLRKLGLRIDQRRKDNMGLCCIATLYRIYERSKTEGVHSVLSIVMDGFGIDALEADILDAVSLMQRRYNGALPDAEITRTLHQLRLNSVRVKAERLRQSLKYGRAACTAAVLVEEINRHRKTGRKLPTWWKKV